MTSHQNGLRIVIQFTLFFSGILQIVPHRMRIKDPVHFHWKMKGKIQSYLAQENDGNKFEQAHILRLKKDGGFIPH